MEKINFDPLADLYELMDKTWEKVAGEYNFKCNGCEDNCCRSLFFHHTYVERAYFLYGFNLMEKSRQKSILNRAQNYCDQTFSRDSQDESLKILCPVNEEGLCLLYEYRPMICRLHGIPHELNRPGSIPLVGPGCDAGFLNETPEIKPDIKIDIKLDRTPFYQQMAQLEMVFRQKSGKSGKIRETVAQMLIS
jgi:hypothetical protein